MQKAFLILACLFAFVVFIRGGERVLVREAVGVGLSVKQYAKDGESVPVVVFVNKEGKAVSVVPVSLFEFCVYVPESGVM